MKARTPVGVLALGLSSAVIVGYSATPASADVTRPGRHATAISSSAQLAELQWQLQALRNDPNPFANLDLGKILKELGPLLKELGPLLKDKEVRDKLFALVPKVLDAVKALDLKALGAKLPPLTTEQVDKLLTLVPSIAGALTKIDWKKAPDLSKVDLAKAVTSINTLIAKLPDLSQVKGETVSRFIDFLVKIGEKLLGALNVAELPAVTGADVAKALDIFSVAINKAPDLSKVAITNETLASLEKFGPALLDLVSALPGLVSKLDLSGVKPDQVLTLLQDVAKKLPDLSGPTGAQLVATLTDIAKNPEAQKLVGGLITQITEVLKQPDAQKKLGQLLTAVTQSLTAAPAAKPKG